MTSEYFIGLPVQETLLATNRLFDMYEKKQSQTYWKYEIAALPSVARNDKRKDCGTASKIGEKGTGLNSFKFYQSPLPPKNLREPRHLFFRV